MDKLFGKYRAMVIDTNDPEKRGRIKTRCPSVNLDIPLAWAESSFPPGIFSVPNLGDFVWIEFEEGDIDKPIWVGMLATVDYVTAQFFPDINKYDPTQKLWVSNTAVIKITNEYMIIFAPVINENPIDDLPTKNDVLLAD